MRYLILTLALALSFNMTAEAQIFEKVKRKVSQKKSQKENEAIDKGIEEVEDIFTKKDKKDGDTSDEGGNEDGASTEGGPSVTPDMSEKKAKEIWMKRYDFKPGKDIIFYDDFESEEIGEIPSKWYYNKGLMEVVTVSGEHNNVMSGDLGYGRPNWPENFELPEAYTIEFDVYMADPNAKPKGYGSYGYSIYLYDSEYRHKVGTISLGHGGISLRNKVSGSVPGLTASDLGNTWNHISISVNGNSVKAYFNDFRVFNTRLEQGAQPVLFTMWNCCQTTERPVFMIDNFKVAAGAHPKYKEEILEGRIVTNNILFETGSAEIISRSYAEVKRIADVMKANPDKSFRIEGHTDNVGTDESNLELSKRRAESVMVALADMGIDSSRMTAEGFGEALPVEDNETPEGRAMNRRVEFIITE